MRQIIHINRNWEFTRNCTDGFISGKTAGAATVSLPHTVCELPFDYFDESEYQMVSGYRRALRLPIGCESERVFLHIGAAAHYAEVFLDGEKIAEHKGGYTAFRVDLTGRLSADRDSLLCIRIDSRENLNIPPFGNVIDYMTYGGLYREAHLEILGQSCIEDIFAMPRVPDSMNTQEMNSDEISALTFDGEIDCRLGLIGAEDHQIRLSVYPVECDNDKPISEQVFVPDDKLILNVPGARLWDIGSPTLYILRAELIKADEPVDRVDTRIGFRRSEFRADGYYLNGRKLKLRGLNRHQSYPYVGYAMPRSMQRYDAEIMKNELGLNAVRTSHYPQSQHFIDRCDELGLLVFTEMPGWQHIGDSEWKDIAVQTMKEMVLQYRNHPSVILWGARINESRDDDEFYTRTNRIAHELDPTRPTDLLEDVFTYNDFIHDGNAPGCDPKRKVTPDMSKPYLVTEYCGHMYPTKSYDNEEIRTEHALRHVRVLEAVAAEEDISGSFGWCFFDYNTHKEFGAGVCDMFRNPKSAAAVYASQQDKTPVLEVSSSMDIGEHPASIRGCVYAFTNADSVRFYKNDEFIREYTREDSSFRHLPHPPIEISDYIGERINENESFGKRQARYVKDILNEAAVRGMDRLAKKTKLKALYLMLIHRMDFKAAYELYGKYLANWGNSASVFRFEAIKGGKVVKVVEKSPFTSRRMEIKVSHTELTEGETYDVAAVRIRITDEHGNTLPQFNSTVKASVEGELELIGPANAPVMGGMGGLYVRTTGRPGKGSLTIEAERIEKQTVYFTIKEAKDEG